MNYTIVKLDDRAKDLTAHNQQILAEHNYVSDIKFFDGNKEKAWDVINHLGIRQDVWAPYDGRSFPPLPGELGIWVSTINIFQYILSNNLDLLLVLEDDVFLHEDFVQRMNECLSDVPSTFDFLALHWFDGHNWVSEQTEIGSRFIHRSHNQFSAGQAIIYSKKGAGKLLSAVKRIGIESTSDCFIFRQSLIGSVDGYSVKPENGKLLDHDNILLVSSIDPQNLRNT